MHCPITDAFLYNFDFYNCVSGPEGSSQSGEADFTYSLLDSYVTPQTNEGPGFCRCKRGPVVNICQCSLHVLEYVIISLS